MGSSVSKATASGIKRKFPGRTAEDLATRSVRRPEPESASARADGKDAAVSTESSGPDIVSADFSRRLHDMGIVEPDAAFPLSSRTQPGIFSPKFRPVSHNTTLSVLEARQLLQRRVDDDIQAKTRRGFAGRRFLYVRSVVEVLRLRAGNLEDSAIEERLSLQPGIVAKLGPYQVLKHLRSKS